MVQNKSADVAEQLERLIRDGLYGPQGGLPNRKALAAQLHTSASTIGEALARLEEKRVIRKEAASYYVDTVDFTMTEFIPSLHSRYPNAFTDALCTARRMSIPTIFAKRLEISELTPVVYQSQVVGTLSEMGDTSPIYTSERCFFFHISDAELTQMQKEPRYNPMYARYPGKLRADDEVFSRMASPEDREILALPEQSSVLGLFQTIYSDTGELLIAQLATHAPQFVLRFRNIHFVNSPALPGM